METYEKLKKLKNSLNEAIDAKIEENKKNALLESVKKLPLFSLTRIFENVSDSLIDSRNGEKIIRNYVRTIMENKSLKRAFAISSMVKHPVNVKDTNTFTNVAMSHLNECNTKHYKKGLKTLSDVICEAIKMSGHNSSDIESIINESKIGINEILQYFLSNKATLKNLTEWSNRLSDVNEFVTKNNKIITDEESKTEDISPKEAFKALKEICSEDGTMEEKIAEKITEMYLGAKTGQELFEECKHECKTVIEEAMENTSLEEKTRLCGIVERLENKEYNKETLEEDVSKMVELSQIINGN